LHRPRLAQAPRQQQQQRRRQQLLRQQLLRQQPRRRQQQPQQHQLRPQQQRRQLQQQQLRRRRQASQRQPLQLNFLVEDSDTTGLIPATSTTTAAFIDQAFWPLDNNALELYNGLNGVLSGTPSYTTSFLGYGAAISLSQASSQYVYISPTVIPLDSRSFTIEAWIYPTGFTA
ncbi:unnamed protein product, partial [Rotaria socialis]